MKNIDIFQMYTGWDINGLVDDCNNRNLIGNIVNCIMGKHQMQKEAELFASQVEEALDAILSGRKWKVKEELEDSLWGRTGTQLAKAEAVFLKKAEESLHEKEIVKGLISDMSHQTRTPIANMKLYMELLEEETLSENGSFF